MAARHLTLIVVNGQTLVFSAALAIDVWHACRSCGSRNAEILSLRRHCQRCFAHGIDRRR